VGWDVWTGPIFAASYQKLKGYKAAEMTL